HGEYTADDISLLDIPWAFGEGRNHVELVTDIIKDENGKVVKIELSGAVRPHCKRRTFTEEEYFEQFKLFSLTRYDLSLVPKLDEDLYNLVLDSPVNYTRPKIAVDNGNKSNYLVGDTTIISACVDGEDTVNVYKDGVLFESTKINGTAKFPRRFERGYYRVELENNGDWTEFCVNKAQISHVVNGDEITITANACDPKSKIVYADFRYTGSDDYQLKGRASSMESVVELTEEEKTSGTFTRKFASDAENFKVYFENEYGVWVHTMTQIK
ncbi:MAG: hypothetical protein J6R83_03415, partial [Clostridia bacterium]|nr:hypothetical protein [Clostridia bacterium]